MSNVVVCPDQSVLQQFLLGQLSTEDVERLAGHVETCGSCVTVLNTLRANDTLVESMKASSVVERPDSRVSELIARLSGKCRPSPDATSDLSSVNSLKPPLDDASAGQRTEIGEETYDFLAPPQAPDEIGRLGPYRVLKVLGAGGMGVVFQAEDPQLRRTIALKTMLPSIAANARLRQRFLREAQAAALLENDHIVPIYQVGEDRGVPYLAMPFLKGMSLEDRLKKASPLNVKQVVRLSIQTARGLAAAHEAGLIHRDIKPANLWIEPEGSGRIKILDFGLARGLGEDSSLTQTGAIVGTPSYMAPEQARGEKIDGRCDLFSFGCVMYRMLTGVQPFQGADTMSTLVALALHEPPPPRVLNAAVPLALSGLVMRLMSKDPAGRPPVAKAVIEALQAIERDLNQAAPAESPQVEQPKPVLEPVRKRLRRGPLVAAAVLLVGVIGVLAGGIILRITSKDGKTTDVELKPGDKLEIVEKPGDKKKTDPPVDAILKLDPAKIPASERFDWQPKELVAVMGEHRQRHWGQARSVSYSADGKLVASCCYTEQFISIWDAETMALKERLVAAEAGEIASVCFSPKGRRLAVGLAGGVALWDLDRGRKPRLFYKNYLPQVAFFPDSGRLACATWKGKTVTVFDITSEEPKAVHEISSQGFKIGLTVSSDGHLLAFATEDKTVHVVDLGGKEPRKRSEFKWPHTGEPWGLTFLPNSQTLAVHDYMGNEATSTYFWDVSERQPKERFQVPVHPRSQKICFSPDGKTVAGVASNNADGVVLWDLIGDKPVRRCQIKDDVDGMQGAFSPDGKTLVLATTTVTYRGAVHFWDVSGKEPVERRPLAEAIPSISVRFADGGKLLATGDYENVWLWDLSGPSPRRRAVIRPKNPIGQFDLSADGKLLATGYGDQGVTLWDLTGAEPVERPAIRGDRTGHEVQCSPDGKSLLTQGVRFDEGGKPLRVRFLWDVTGKEPKRRHVLEVPGEDPASDAAFSPDGKTLAAGTTKGNVHLWDLSDGEPRRRASLKREVEGRLAFSPDGKLLLTSSQGTCGVWDVSGQTPHFVTYPGPLAGYLTSARFAGNRSVMTSCRNGASELWDILNEAELKKLKMFGDPQKPRLHWRLPGQINDLAVTPDGSYAATANGNGTVYILRVPPPAK